MDFWRMDVLFDEEELTVQQTVAKFFAAECAPAVVRSSEKEADQFSRTMWKKFASLGWLAICLPSASGGQALPLTYLGLLFEEIGRNLAPIPLLSTMVPALIAVKHGKGREQLIARVGVGDALLSFAIQEEDGRWSSESIKTTAKIDGDGVVISGKKFFVDNFRSSEACLVMCRFENGDRPGSLGLIFVDPGAPGVTREKLITLANDAAETVTLDGVHVPLGNILCIGQEAADDLMDYSAIFHAMQMQGAARAAMEMAAKYVSQRDAFGQPIGAFQAIQHLAADMLNAVDGVQLLAREAVWRLSKDLPARVEISQAKSFANEKCVMVCRGAQQMHGGIGFIAEFDINLWYRRATAWSLRAGTTYEHRKRIAASLLDQPGTARLGMPQVVAASPGSKAAARGLD
jgi:alkylation response protein AidB-like acyl-CoA dehydrogenase